MDNLQNRKFVNRKLVNRKLVDRKLVNRKLADKGRCVKSNDSYTSMLNSNTYMHTVGVVQT